MARWLPITLALATGCYAAHECDAATTDARLPDAHVDDAEVSDAGRDAGSDAWRSDAWSPPPCDPTRAPTSVMPCAAMVRFPSLALSGPGCFVDTRATEGELGALTWDCMGGGAQLRFPSGAVFGGSVLGDQLELCETTSYDHDCHWVSDQRITGSISTRRLDYTYDESTPAGPCLTSSACSAQGETTITF